jgi:hypothetical protein
LHGSVRSRIRYPLLANAVQRLLTAMVGQDREEANRLQQAKWELTSRIRDESNVPNAFHFSRRSRKRSETVPQRVTASQGTTLCKIARNSVNRLELRKNVVANYPFESSRGFPARSAACAPCRSRRRCPLLLAQEIPQINFLRSELSAMVKIEAAMMLGSRPRVSDDQAPSARPPARRSPAPSYRRANW